MKILFLTQRIPYPPNKGDKLRSFNEIKYLSRSHSISLVCLADSQEEFSFQNELLKYCESVEIVFHSLLSARAKTLMGFCSSRPLTLSHFHSTKLQKIVDRKLKEERFDLIFVYCSSMAQYVEYVQRIPRVIDYVDVDSEKWAQYSTYASFPMSLIYGLESRRLRSYERKIAATYQYGFLVSERECDDFRCLVKTDAVVAPISNGVDLEMFQPSAEPYDSDTIVFTGAMDYFANVDAVLYFAEEILPLVRREVPGAKFLIVGSNPVDEVKRLAANDSQIVVTGFVDRVQPYVHRSAVFVAPMRIARGVQNKILEAMAMGVPVVTSPLGFEGITAVSGKDVFVEEKPEPFARIVSSIMRDRALRAEMADRGRGVVERYYNWSTNLKSLTTCLDKVIGDVPCPSGQP